MMNRIVAVGTLFVIAFVVMFGVVVKEMARSTVCSKSWRMGLGPSGAFQSTFGKVWH